MEGVGVRNVSARTAVAGSFRPDALVVLRPERPPSLIFGGDAYRSGGPCDVLAVYLREGRP